jgi:hypothetical protein
MQNALAQAEIVLSIAEQRNPVFVSAISKRKA